MTSPFTYYYSEVSFGAMVPIAISYNVIANVAASLLRPLGLFPSCPSAPRAVKDTAGRKKLAIVTGSNTGIGFETARSLVENGFDVILACRSEAKAQQAVHAITKQQENRHPLPGKALFVGCLDLDSFESIKAFAKVIKSRYTKIDVLVNNAGRNTSGPSLARDDLDLCFQTNFLGHFALTCELLPLLENAGGGKVINVSSVMHHFCAATGSTRELFAVDYWKRVATYGQAPDSTYAPSKLAALLFTQELNRRYANSRGIRSIAVNPGAVNSEIWRDFPKWMIPLFRVLYLDSNQGCHTTVAAVLGDFTGSSTQNEEYLLYLQPYWLPPWIESKCPPFPVYEMMGPFVGCRATKPRLPVGSGAAESLWKASEELTTSVFPTS